MTRVKVKILKTCVLGKAGNEMNLLESQLPRFEGMCEVVKGGSKKIPSKKTASKSKKTVEVKEEVVETPEVEVEVEAPTKK